MASDAATFGVARVPAKEAVACAHCHLPVPAGLIVAERDEQFCCNGCQAVWELLQQRGLGRFYDQLDDEQQMAPVRPTGRSYTAWDDPTFTALHVQPLPGGQSRVRLYLEGIHCTACVWLVEKLPLIEKSVSSARLDFGRGLVTVVWDRTEAPLSRVAERLDGLGYPSRPFRAGERERIRRDEDRKLLLRIGVASAAAGNVMLIAFALYGGMFAGMATEHEALMRWASLIISIPSVLWAGAPFFRGAWSSLKVRSLHMDLPVAIALAAGLAWGAVNTIRAEGEVYFDTVTVLVALLLGGRWVQRRSERRATDAAELMMTLTPLTAHLEDGREVPVEALEVGNRVRVRPGDSVPADGIVVDGGGFVDTAVLTGESRPTALAAGDPVFAGTICRSRTFLVEVQATGEQTRMGKLMTEVERVSKQRAPIVRLADRIAGGFVAVVLFLAALCVGLWWSVSPEAAIENAVALLVVTCPCALGLATPLAVSVAIGRAAHRGLLVRGGAALEALAHPGTLLLDKTGTVTTGQPAVVDWVGDPSARALVAALEADSTHPVGRALAAVAEPAAVVSQVDETLGHGVAGVVDGRQVAVGSARWIRERLSASEGAALADEWRAAISAAAANGHTPVLVAVDNIVVALAAVGDPIRPDAREVIDNLTRDGWQVALLSGDHPEVVRAVGAQLGLPAERCTGGASPESKLATVEARLRAGESVVMVGDGVNDSGALAAATVGIAMHGGAEASLMAADIFASRPGLSPIAEATDVARRTVRTIRRNLVLSAMYNVTGASLALAGLMNPLVAAILMPLSSITVVTSSLRGAGGTRPEPTPAPQTVTSGGEA